LNERLYVQQDANGNVTALVDTSGNVQERYVYDPFGAVTILAPNWTTRGSSSFAWIYLHQAGRFDTATGLYNFRNRDYSPALGRWIQVDPLGLEPDNNVYRYVGNTPTSLRDPTGLIEWYDWIPGVNIGVWIYNKLELSKQEAIRDELIARREAMQRAKPGTIGLSQDMKHIPDISYSKARQAWFDEDWNENQKWSQNAASGLCELYAEFLQAAGLLVSGSRFVFRPKLGGWYNLHKGRLATAKEIKAIERLAPIKSLSGKTLAQVEKGIPNTWRRIRSSSGHGWKWIDEQGRERLRYMYPDKNGWFWHEKTGYWRWRNANGQHLDEFGDIVDPNDTFFDQKTHIPISGVNK
jgi:RHS repeat-associated protein